jgi:hypothetical protein
VFILRRIPNATSLVTKSGFEPFVREIEVDPVSGENPNARF